MVDESRGLYAVQFHPEVTHTRQGQRIIERFVHEICGLGALWVPARILEDSVESLREKVGVTGTSDVIDGRRPRGRRVVPPPVISRASERRSVG